MGLVDLSFQHGQTQDEARAQLERTVADTQSRFGRFLSSVAWSDDNHRVLMKGMGFEIEVWIDALQVHLRGDIPLVGQLLGGKLLGGIKGLLERDFQKRLT